MSVVTVTVSTAGTDTLTAVGHGLLTGDRFRIRNVGGTLPTGLAAVTDYFAIRVDANNLKVAISSANALAGTPVVDITSALGAGTTTVEYGLPYCIPTAIAAAATQIKSANDNGAWNALVALYSLLTGQAQTVWSAVTFATGILNSLTLAANQHVTVSGTGDFKHGDRTLMIPAYQFVGVGSAVYNTAYTFGTASHGVRTLAAVTLRVPIPLRVGDQIKSVTYTLAGNSSADVTSANVYKLDLTTNTETSIGSSSNTDPGAALADTTIDVTDTVVTSSMVLYAEFVVNATDLFIYGLKVVYDRP